MKKTYHSVEGGRIPKTGAPVVQVNFRAERPMLRDSQDKVEFWEGDTRYYRIHGKTFDADTHDRLMGVGNIKPRVLSKGEERSVERLRYRDGREYIAKKRAAKKK